MINKSTLQSFISKYYLGGLHNQVKWRVKDNQLVVYAGSPGRVCKTQLDIFEFEDSELGIFDTNKLLKLISVTNGDLLLSSEKINQLHTKLNIADSNFELSYALADTLILGKTKWYNDPEDGFEIELELSTEDVDHLIKAKNALGDNSSLQIHPASDLDGQPVCEFLFGDDTGFSSKIQYQVQGIIKENSSGLKFDSGIFKEILVSNKDLENCQLKLSNKGMMKISFQGTINDVPLSSIYYIAINE
jgi:hypothetical protein|tara:strand:- start:688 stop:1425 length:738 start_codon:yes stop_codon:yes gene_type:complete